MDWPRAKLSRLRERWLQRPISDLFSRGTGRPRALICYVPRSHRGGSIKRREPSHQNIRSGRVLAGVLDSRGYVVDVCHYNSSAPRPPYDLIIGLEPGLLNAMKQSGPDAVTIYLATGAHHEVQNAAELDRLRRLEARRGASLCPRRLVAAHSAAEAADIVACVGGSWTQQSYVERGCPTVLRVHEPAILPSRSDSVVARQSLIPGILWMGSSGLVHKGLDLVLEAFAGRDDVILHVVGSLAREPDFTSEYRAELAAENVRVYGWLEIGGAQFRSVVDNCTAIVFPSCSEAAAGSVLTAMSQGLIPIVTRETGLDLPSGLGRVVEPSVEKLRTASSSVLSLSPEQLDRTSHQCAAWVARMHNENRCHQDFDRVVRTAEALGGPSV